MPTYFDDFLSDHLVYDNPGQLLTASQRYTAKYWDLLFYK
jgi:hypothetical protein